MKKGVISIIVISVALVLAAAVAIPLLLATHALTAMNALGYIGFFFFIFMNVGVIIFAHKMLSGKAYDIIFALCCSIMISFFFAIIIFSIHINSVGSIVDFYIIFGSIIFFFSISFIVLIIF